MKKANAVMTVLALVFVSLPAMAGVEFDSSINYYQGGGYQSIEADGSDDSHISYQSFSGGPWTGWTVTNGESFGMTSGYADAANLKLGDKAQMISTPMNNHLSDARISTDASNRLTGYAGNIGSCRWRHHHPGDQSPTGRFAARRGDLLAGKGLVSRRDERGLNADDYSIQIDTGESVYSPSEAFWGFLRTGGR